MLGRSCPRLLTFSLLVLITPLASGQASRLVMPDVDSTAPRLLQPPFRTPAQGLPRLVPSGTVDFPQIARAAGAIFSGRVLGISHEPATRGRSIETVRISFRVENAIRGATPGETLTIAQWMGLWSSGQRYRLGEHVFLMLYPPSKLGLTSCVAAQLGRFNVDPSGRIQLDAQQLSAFRKDPVLGGKSHVTLRDFALAVRRASEEE
jgi:hypothetical protein